MPSPPRGNNRSRLRKLLSSIANCLLAIILGAIVCSVGLLISPILMVRTAVIRRRFRRRFAGRIIFYYTPKRGYRDFIHNNVLPVLPEDVISVQMGRQVHDDLHHPARYLPRAFRIARISRPFFVLIGRYKPVVLSANLILAPLKRSAAASVETQHKIREQLAGTLAEIAGTGRTLH